MKPVGEPIVTRTHALLRNQNATPIQRSPPMHRDQRFDAVPKDYLRWIAGAPISLRDEVRSSARYWINVRENQ